MRLCLKYDDFTLAFSLREGYTITVLEKTPGFRWDEYEYAPSGKLEFILETCYGVKGPSTWKDRKIKRVEDSLGIMVIQAKRHFDHQFERREEKRRQEELRREREAYEAFLKGYRKSWKNQRSNEEWALKLIKKQVKSMMQADRLGAYIKACETRMAKLEAMGDPATEDDCLKLNWLKARLEMLDPFVANTRPWDVVPLSVAVGAFPEVDHS
jgi:hypothetical protein